MRKLTLLLLVTIVATTSQAAQTRPEVEVLKFGWRKMPKNTTQSRKQEITNANLDARISEEYRKEKPDQGIIRDLERQKQNQITLPDQPKAQGNAYEYKFRFRNNSRKAVKSLRWVYIFKDGVTGQELVRHRFESKVRIGPGQEKRVTAYADASPPLIVNAASSEKAGTPWVEEAILELVEYADGSNWHRE